MKCCKVQASTRFVPRPLGLILLQSLCCVFSENLPFHFHTFCVTRNITHELVFFEFQSFSFFDVLANLSVTDPVVSNGTLTMEQLGQNYGFLLYRTKIPGSVEGSTANISIPGLRDRGVVFVDQVSCLSVCCCCCCCFFLSLATLAELVTSPYLLTRKESACVSLQPARERNVLRASAL